MHDAKLMQDLMRRVDAVSAANGGARVRAVRVRLGALSHFSPEHFREHFDEAAVGGCAEGARVDCESCADINAAHAQGVTLLAVEVDEA